LKILLGFLAVFLVIFGLSNTAFADVGGYSDNGNDPFAMFQFMFSVGSQFWYLIRIVLVVIGVIGIVFIIMGLLKIRSSALESQGGNSHLKHGILLLILGALLFGGPVLMMLVGNSIFGTAPVPVAYN
jgi:glucose uptake protein GlcU